MFIIVDNGENWDDHSIGFCEVPDRLYTEHKEVVERLALLQFGYATGQFIVATAREMVWRGKMPMRSLSEAIGPAVVVRSGGELPRPVLKYLLDAWKKVPPGDAAEHLLLIERFEARKPVAKAVAP